MTSTISVEPIEVTLSSILMLLPDYTSLKRALESRGYTLRDKARGRTITLATKGSIEVFSNVDRRTIGIRSETSTRDLLVAHEDLEQINKEIGTEESNMMIHEFIGAFTVTSTKSPLETIKTLTIGQDILRKLGSIMETELVTLGLSVTTKNGIPTASEWLHLDIEPLFVGANKKYSLRVVYRGKIEEVISFVKKIESRIKKIIEELEGVS